MISIMMRFLFIFAISIMTMQAVHLSYVNWFIKTDSLIADDEEMREEKNLRNASLDQLAERYAEAKEKASIYEKDTANPKISTDEMYSQEPYKTLNRLTDAIKEREDEKRGIFRHWYLWGWGLAITLGGLYLFRKVNEFAGQAFILAGFVEMLQVSFMTLHSYRMSYDAFALTRFVSSLLNIGLLVIAAHLSGLFKEDDDVLPIEADGRG